MARLDGSPDASAQEAPAAPRVPHQADAPPWETAALDALDAALPAAMADVALRASADADAERSAAPARDVPALAALSNRSAHSAEPASAAVLCRQAAARFEERSCAAAEPRAEPASRALQPPVARAEQEAQPGALLLELMFPLLLPEAEAVLPDGQA